MEQKSNTVASIFFMVTGMAIVGIIDNFVKFISVEISLWQFHFLRSLIAVPVVVIFGLLAGWNLKPRRLWPVLGRNMFLTGAMFVYFGCLGFFPIAAVAAGLFTAPVLVIFIDRYDLGVEARCWRIELGQSDPGVSRIDVCLW